MRAALAVGALAVLALWWHGPSSVHGAGAIVTSAGRVAGLLGAYLVLVQLLLMARLPWLERAVGFDRLASWHRGLGTNVVLLLGAHVLLIVQGYALSAHTGTLAQGVSIVKTLPDMLPAVGGMALFAAVAVSSARAVRRRVSYETWYRLHVSAYVAVALSFSHQVSTGVDFATDPAARLLWTGLYAATAAAVVVWRVVLPARRWFRHRLVVDAVVAEAPGVVSVWVRGRDLESLGARAGQFMLWRFVTAGHLLSAHPYSLSALPDGRRLRITVAAAGDHSARLAALRPGTPVLAEGPFGRFTADSRVTSRALLVAAGSGIGPVRALAEDLAGRPGSRAADVVVVHRASTRAQLALGGELATAAAERRIVVHQIVGSRRELGHDPLAARRLARLVPDLLDRDVFVCGPADLTITLLAGLRGLGVPAGQLHAEDFAL